VIGAATGAAAGVTAASGSAPDSDGSASETLSPMIDTALPTMLIGAVMSARAWVPESSPSSPVVSAAFATVAPSSVMPPARSVPRRARLVNLFMISP
jgi:hypothetical protein